MWEPWVSHFSVLSPCGDQLKLNRKIWKERHAATETVRQSSASSFSGTRSDRFSGDALSARMPPNATPSSPSPPARATIAMGLPPAATKGSARSRSKAKPKKGAQSKQAKRKKPAVAKKKGKSPKPHAAPDGPTHAKVRGVGKRKGLMTSIPLSRLPKAVRDGLPLPRPASATVTGSRASYSSAAGSTVSRDSDMPEPRRSREGSLGPEE